MYNTIFVYIVRVPVSMKGSKGHQKSRKQRKQTGFKELAHICVLCSAIASPSLLSSSPIRVNPNSTQTQLGQLGLTALRAIIDGQPYGSSDLGGDHSDDEPPSMTSASPSEDDDPEDSENPSGQKKKKKRKTKHHEGRKSEEAKAIATCKIVVNLPEFTGKDLSEFAENFG